jgi:predicted nucleic acid-binding protein
MNGTIADHLRGKSRIHLDSMTVIYFIERNPTYRPIVRPLFELVDVGEFTGLSSYVTLLEVMVQPIRSGRLDLAREYRNILVRSRNIILFPVDRPIAEAGADIRARYGIRTPDAIQLATALRQRADAFVTNDTRLRRFDRLEVVVLDDFLSMGR